MSVKCMDRIVDKVLIDNGSSLNVMPKTTLDKFPFDTSQMRPSSMVVRAFDGSDVRGEINLLIQIGPHKCLITFQVMDINLAYSCLLGRPWIHSVGVVLSMLHQKLKFMVEGQLVIVPWEEDILVSCPSSTPCVEAACFYFCVFFLVSPRDSCPFYFLSSRSFKKGNVGLRFRSSLCALKDV